MHRTTGATFRFMTGRTLGQSGKASATATDSERSVAFLFPDPESEQHPPPIGCHPSAPNTTVEQVSGVGDFVVNVEPYFVRSTASASEILTNVAIQDMLAIEDLRFYELSCNPQSSSTLSSVPEPSGSFDFVYPFASSESFDSDSRPVNGSPRSSREASPEVSPNPSDGHGAFKSGSSRSVYINDTMRFISSSEVEVTFRNTYSDSPLEEDDADGEEVIILPVLPCTSSSFPHPHCLSTIPEEDEDEDGHSLTPDAEDDDEESPEDDYEDETSSVETIRCSSISVRA
ncbi:hypothetical protein EI94DRAFT_777188 [Lactarius quietus]|nr:hypothetical protein EI94DRAFT_777188 [Lactarius quietus]